MTAVSKGDGGDREKRIKTERAWKLAGPERGEKVYQIMNNKTEKEEK